MTSLAHNTTNDTRLADLMRDVGALGRAEAEGKDALPMLALKVAYAAADGVISGDKDSDGQDDYAKIYAKYAKERGKKEVHEHTAGGLKAQVSKLRVIGTAATMTTANFYGSINKGLKKREELLGDKQKVRPAYHMIVDMARTQTNQPDDLTDDQIEVSARKPESEPDDLEARIKAMHKISADLIEGKKGVQCQEQWLVDIHTVLESQIAQFTFTRERNETLAKAAALGLHVVPAVTQEVTICTDAAQDGYVA